MVRRMKCFNGLVKRDVLTQCCGMSMQEIYKSGV